METNQVRKAKYFGRLAFIWMAGVLLGISGCDGDKYGGGSGGGQDSSSADQTGPSSDSELPESRVLTDEMNSRNLRSRFSMKCPPEVAAQLSDGGHTHPAKILKDGRHVLLLEKDSHTHPTELSDEQLDELCRSGDSTVASGKAFGHRHNISLSL